MYKFSEKSKGKLLTCNEKIQDIFNEVIKFYDITILCGYRRKEEQDQHYKEGKSKVKWPNSKHNVYPSNAIDVAPYPLDWFGIKRYFYLAGIVMGVAHMKEYEVVWGGDWDSDNDFSDQTFNDLGHFEVE